MEQALAAFRQLRDGWGIASVLSDLASLSSDQGNHTEARRLYAAARQPRTMIEVADAVHAQTWFGPTKERELAALAAWTAPRSGSGP